MGIQVEQSSTGFGLSGKASTGVYNDLLRHLVWSYSGGEGEGLKRCLKIQCTATIQDDERRMIAFHRSGQLETKVGLKIVKLTLFHEP